MHNSQDSLSLKIKILKQLKNRKQRHQENSLSQSNENLERLKQLRPQILELPSLQNTPISTKQAQSSQINDSKIDRKVMSFVEHTEKQRQIQYEPLSAQPKVRLEKLDLVPKHDPLRFYHLIILQLVIKMSILGKYWEFIIPNLNNTAKIRTLTKMILNAFSKFIFMLIIQKGSSAPSSQIPGTKSILKKSQFKISSELKFVNSYSSSNGETSLRDVSSRESNNTQDRKKNKQHKRVTFVDELPTRNEERSNEQRVQYSLIIKNQNLKVPTPKSQFNKIQRLNENLNINHDYKPPKQQINNQINKQSNIIQKIKQRKQKHEMSFESDVEEELLDESAIINNSEGRSPNQQQYASFSNALSKTNSIQQRPKLNQQHQPIRNYEQMKIQIKKLNGLKLFLKQQRQIEIDGSKSNSPMQFNNTINNYHKPINHINSKFRINNNNQNY